MSVGGAFWSEADGERQCVTDWGVVSGRRSVPCAEAIGHSAVAEQSLLGQCGERERRAVPVCAAVRREAVSKRSLCGE